MSQGNKPVTGAVLVKEFLGGSAITLAEFREFWNNCSAEDKLAFSERAAEALGCIKSTIEPGKYERP